MPPLHRHYNGLKTAALFGAIWALLLGIGALVAGGRFIWFFALIGLATTFYGYWNSDKLAIRAMHAYPVSEAQAPAMYRIVRELSTAAGKPMPRLFISPTQAPNASTTATSSPGRSRPPSPVSSPAWRRCSCSPACSAAVAATRTAPTPSPCSR